ncbi:MAG: ribonuclease HII [Micavibrio aeruginosavorus]|uniref:Ribonuclease HII n=1 Tax=Micavibrio aeruginosavorus TaxID=349221 RepID=A0A7T5UG25_9BACT|nr:MAG: ribonuclease HII [Micavibrio aeruginosavorus]
MACSFDIENQLNGPVCGIDEAGRGPLAGPVVAACVYIPESARKESFWTHVNDSKKLTARKRGMLYDLIVMHAHYGIAEASVKEIDDINILRASLLAMTRSLEAMVSRFDLVPSVALVDGNSKPELPCQIKTVVKGDSLSLSIAAASILAKVTRDRIMEDLCRKFPMYGWSRNAGYGTTEHLRAINDHGVTTHHRRSFSPVKRSLTV